MKCMFSGRLSEGDLRIHLILSVQQHSNVLHNILIWKRTDANIDVCALFSIYIAEDINYIVFGRSK